MELHKEKNYLAIQVFAYHWEKWKDFSFTDGEKKTFLLLKQS